MADFNSPTNTTTYTSVLTAINDKISSVAKMLFSGDTNIPTGTLQYNRTTRTFEEWSGSSWVKMRVEQPGVIKPFGGTTAPEGHLLCDGTALNTYTYRELHKVISNFYGGTAYLAGTTDQVGATTTFNVPNLKGRFPLGKADSGTGATLGGIGGSIDHRHTIDPHYHTRSDTLGGTLNISTSGGVTSAKSKTNITIADASTAHTHTGTTNAGEGAHQHDAVEGVTADSGSGTINNIRITGGTGVTVTADNIIRTTGSSHQHTFTTNGMSANATHGHTVTEPNSGSGHDHTIPGHTHAASSITGTIGAFATGVNGDESQNTGTNNPPFVALNYIITF